MLAAAIAHAGLPAKIIYHEAEMQTRWNLVAKPRRAPFVPGDDELARFLSAPNLPDALFRWLIISILTGCRPEAAMDLAPAQLLRQAHLIDLNPHGRAQKKKHRPIVRAPHALEGWLDKWERDDAAEAAKREAIQITSAAHNFTPARFFPREGEVARSAEGGGATARYCQYASLESAQTAIERLRAREDVNLPRFSAYSIRHKVVTVLRLSRITGDEIALQVGHRRPDLRTTSAYGEWSPEYLARSAAARDAWLLRLQRLTDRPLFSRRIPKTLRRRIKRAA